MKAKYFDIEIEVCDEVTKYWGSFTYGPSIYEPEKLERFAGLLNGGVLIDVGASTGSYTMLPLVVPGLEVHAFEPCERTISALAKNIRLNNVKDVTLNCCAVSNYDGIGQLNEPVNDFNLGLSILGGNPPIWKDTRPKSTRVTKLDTYCKNIIPTAIKIDTEGNDLYVLDGALMTIKKHHPIIQVEYVQENCNQYGYNRILIYDFLKYFDYKIEIIDNSEILAI